MSTWILHNQGVERPDPTLKCDIVLIQKDIIPECKEN